MANMELDPLFVRGLRLLHSKSKDSAEQLRQLLDDVIAQKCVGGNPRETISKPIASIKQESDIRVSSSGKKQSPKHVVDIKQEEPRRREADKRSFDKLKQELTDFSGESKRSRMNSPYSSMSSSPSPQPIRLDDACSKEVSEDSDDTEDAEDFAMKMGLACIVCRQLEVSPRNQLIECQECHNLYHQECHRPAVTDHDVNDPRHVWYCARCMKNMKKVVSKSQKVSKPSPVLVSKDSPTSTKIVPKTEVVLPSLLPFKRTEIKSSVSQGGFGGNNKPTGLASLAANLSSRTTSSTTSGGKNFSMGKPSASTPSLPKTSSAFPSLSSLSSSSSSTSTSSSSLKPSPPQSLKPSGLSALASAAAVVAKTSSSGGNGKAGLSLLGSSSSSGGGRSSSSSGNGGNGGSAAVGAKVSASSSLMSADKRLQIMKKKAAAKMQEKRRLSSK